MRNKKTIAIATAAMSMATVVPAFANEVQDVKNVNVDVRKASGQELKAYTRDEAYNTNFTTDINDDTLKVEGKVIKEIKGQDEKTKKDYLYIVATDAKASEVEVAKGLLAAAKIELTEYYNDKNAKVVELEKEATPLTVEKEDDTFKVIDSKRVFEVTITEDNKEIKKTYTFNGTEVAETVTPEQENLSKLFEGIKPGIVFNPKQSNVEDYLDLNTFKYVLEQNADKFDIVKTEIAGTNLEVKVYRKGTKEVIFTMELANMQLINKDLIVNIPAKTDVDGHWAEKEIKEAMLRGYIDASATFRHKDGITRAEFAKVVCNIFGITMEDGQEEPFSDVKKGDWYYNYVVALYNKGGKGTIINGYEDETFRPNAKITRQESAKMVASAYELVKGTNLTITGKETNEDIGLVETKTEDQKTGKIVDVAIKTSFKDDADIAAWADQSIEALSEAKILKGNPDGNFNPKNEITRAEAVLMLMNAR